MDFDFILQITVVMVVLVLSVQSINKIRIKWECEKERTLLFLGFPEEIKDFWSCYAWSKLTKEDRWSFPSNMPENTEVIHMAIVKRADKHDKVVAYRIGKRYGVYELIEGRRMRGGNDRAAWDDGMEYDMKLIDVIDQEEAEMITEVALPKWYINERERGREKAKRDKEDEELLKKCFDEQEELKSKEYVIG